MNRNKVILIRAGSEARSTKFFGKEFRRFAASLQVGRGREGWLTPILHDLANLVPPNFTCVSTTSTATSNKSRGLCIMEMIKENGGAVLGASESIKLKVAKLRKLEQCMARIRKVGKWRNSVV